MVNRSFVEMAIERWSELEAGLSSVLVRSDVMRLPDGSKAAISIETCHYLAMVEIWERPSSLDTTLVPNGKRQGNILAAGACGDRAEMEHRLRALQSALLHRNGSEEGGGAA